MCTGRANMRQLLGVVIVIAAIVISPIGLTAQASSPQAAPKTDGAAGPPAPKGPSLGVPASAADIAAMDVSIGPDGAGLPPGSGTSKQGAEVFASKCIMVDADSPVLLDREHTEHTGQGGGQCDQRR